jgi:hypothetical protein
MCHRVRAGRAVCCHHVLDGLQATLLSVEPGRQSQHTQWVLKLHREETPAEATLEAAAERAEERRVLFHELSTQSHASERFAEDVLGVSLETWFGTQQVGGRALEDVREVLDDGRWKRHAAEERTDSKAEPGDDNWVTLEDVVEVRYEALRMTWEEAVPDL